jgi:hypothetical protein
MEHFGVSITADMFASAANHVSSIFVAQYFTPGCSGVHALKQDWRGFQSGEQAGIVWIFPPLGCTSLVLSLLSQYKVNALVCLSIKAGSLEGIQLRRLSKLGAQVSAGFGIPRAAYCCEPSLRVPSRTVNPAFMGLTVYHITLP